MRTLEESPSHKLDIAVEGILYALLAFMPLAFGVVRPGSELILLVAVAILLGLVAARLLIVGAAGPIPGRSAMVLVGFFVGVILLQLIPLPHSLAGLLSPETVRVKQGLLGRLAEQTPLADANRMALSFYPYATVHGLRLVLAMGGLFMVVLATFRTRAQIKRLLTVITGVGAAVAVLALLQMITEADKIYWVVPLPRGMAHAGPFVNHSHFGQFMNLSIGAALGLLFMRFHEMFAGRRFSMTTVAEYATSPQGRWVWLIAGMVILSVAAVFASLTRGGMISLLIAASFTTVLLTARGSIRGRGWIMAVLAIGAFVCVLYVGFDAVYDRLATLRDLERAQSGRWQILQDIGSAWTRFPWIGTGLDTHAVVYPMFDRSTIPALAAHAENEYAQTLEETGLLGFLPLAAFGVLVWAAFVRCLRTARRPVCSAAYGLGFGLLAILLHSVSDFGQHLSANAGLSAIFAALLLAIARIGRQEPSEASPQVENPAEPAPEDGSGRGARLVGTLAAVLAVALAWLIVAPGGALAAREAQRHWNRALALAEHLEGLDWQGSNPQYIDLIRFAGQAADLQPGNVEYRHWLNVYRWRAISRQTQPTGELVLGPRGIEHTRRLVAEFAEAIRLCPTYGPAWTMAGQLNYYVLGDKDLGRRQILTGCELAPCDATVCFVAGLLEVTEDAQVAASVPVAEGEATDPRGDPSPGLAYFVRACTLDGRLFTECAAIYVDTGQPDLALELAGDDVGRLSRLAGLLARREDGATRAETVRERLFELLSVRAAEPDAAGHTLAALAGMLAERGREDEAVALYRRALTLEYGHVGWRLALARLLAQNGESAAAIHQARICLRLSPQHAGATRLLEELATSDRGTSPDQP